MTMRADMIQAMRHPAEDGAPAWDRTTFEARLRDRGRAYHILHPYNVMLNTGRATPAQIRGWVANRFYYQIAIPIKDAAILAKEATGAIVLVGANRVSRHQLQESLDGLQAVGARVAGLVLSMAPTRGPDAYGYGSYGAYVAPSAEAAARDRAASPTPDATASESAPTASPESSGQPVAESAGEASVVADVDEVPALRAHARSSDADDTA